MKLIFITRKVDRGDALSGFVLTWIEKLASHLEKLYVICQEKGDIAGLSSNVEVYSFGKEKGYGRIRQGYQLFILSCKLGRKASGFFVHMHPIYAITAWLPAKLLGRKMVLWYTHKSADLKLKIAHKLVDAVLTASRESFRIDSKKVKMLGHGINLEKFIPSTSSVKNTKFKILSIGRISPVKDYETLIKAADLLVKHFKIKDFVIEIYGRIGLPKHQSYLDSLVDFVKNAELEDYVKFKSELNYDFVDEVYQEADLFVNLSQTGSIDKTVLEAAASELLVLTSNEAFCESLGKISPSLLSERDNPNDLAEKIMAIRNFSFEETKRIKTELRSWVEREHNLDNLVKQIIKEFET